MEGARPLTDRFDRRRLRTVCELGSVVPVGGLLVAFHTGSVAPAPGCLAVLSLLAAGVSIAGPVAMVMYDVATEGTPGDCVLPWWPSWLPS
ncbi:hypothetical protein [Nonomuraea jabiensis]|uniref:hypothetical protein n=1 Tax=Nonomuraea jabiensis TaxID=882448 RepID=UPI0036CB955F